MTQRTNPSLPVHDGRSFTWDRGIGYAEASDLLPRLSGRIRPDSSDEGFHVQSHKTGVKKLFVATGEVRRAMSGDVLSWTYKSADGFVVEVFND